MLLINRFLLKHSERKMNTLKMLKEEITILCVLYSLALFSGNPKWAVKQLKIISENLLWKIWRWCECFTLWKAVMNEWWVSTQFGRIFWDADRAFPSHFFVKLIWWSHSTLHANSILKKSQNLWLFRRKRKLCVWKLMRKNSKWIGKPFKGKWLHCLCV